ncbi:hypothetical protein D3C80_1377640 [compost metagenome]
MEITLTGIRRIPVNLHAEQPVALQRQVCRYSGFLQRPFFPVAGYRSYTDSEPDVEAERHTAARLVIILGLLLDTGQHILKRTFLAFVAIRTHVRDIVRNDIQTLLQAGHGNGSTDRRIVHRSFPPKMLVCLVPGYTLPTSLTAFCRLVS